MRAAGVILIILLCSGCRPERVDSIQDINPRLVSTGADVLVESGFAQLSGKRIGLIGNQTSLRGDSHLVDLIQESDSVQLTAIFAPEHGFQGEAEAGQKVQSDSSKRVPVYSLYGETRAPSPAMLENVDALVFDIQDIGARFYTYISTMGYAMQAAARNGVEFVVLDRPNPLGGNLVEGFIRGEDAVSFVSLYPIPTVHGLTIGELAKLIQGERYLEDLDNLHLTVINADGWEREMLWPEVDQEWIPTSPNIPNFLTALIYPGTCLLEATPLNEGRGTPSPFLVFGAPEVNATGAIQQLNTAALEGVSFRDFGYTPVSIPGYSASPRHMDTALQGIQIVVEDESVISPHALGVHILAAVRDNSPAEYHSELFKNDRWMKLLSGSDMLRTQLMADASADEIIASWQQDVADFRRLRAPYLLY